MDVNTKLIQPEDYRLFVEKPDPNFSPARNKAIIQETMKETEKFFSELAKPSEDMMDRIDIFTSYATYRFNKGQKDVRDYLGKKLYGQVVGENILEKVRVLESTDRLGKKGRFIQL